MSQELASRLGVKGDGRNQFVGRKEHERREQKPEPKPEAPKGLGNYGT